MTIRQIAADAASTPARWRRVGLALLLLLAAAPFLLPDRVAMPVAGATMRDWNPQSFWHAPWGRSGVHKGIDIFAREGIAVRSSSDGMVVFAGTVASGGHVVAVLGPRWRVHYYAHLRAPAEVAAGDWIAAGRRLGQVGTSGNARGKPPHLHYAVISMIPMPWRATTQAQGGKRMFYLDPGGRLT